MTGRHLSTVRFSSLSLSTWRLTFEAVGLVTVEALGVYGLSVAILAGGGLVGVRFLTIGTCFLAATIWAAVSNGRRRGAWVVRTLSICRGGRLRVGVEVLHHTSKRPMGLWAKTLANKRSEKIRARATKTPIPFGAVSQKRNRTEGGSPLFERTRC
jgi:hypothetical protein